MIKVFVSYAHEDILLIDDIIREIESRGIDVWYDKKIQGGAPWKKSIEENIPASNFVLMMVTPKAAKSVWVRKEINLAQLHAEKNTIEGFVIPLLIVPCKPPNYIADYQYIDCTGNIVSAIERVWERIKEPSLATADRDLFFNATRKEYLDSVCNQYRLLELRGIAPRSVDDPDRLLSTSYVDLNIEDNWHPTSEFFLDERNNYLSQPPIPQNDAFIEANHDRNPNTESITQEIHQLHATNIVPPKILNIWDVVAHGQTILLGEPGSGKSTTARYLALCLAGEKGTIFDPRLEGRIPILINLAKFERRKDSEPSLRLVDHLCDQFDLRYEPFLKYELEKGKCLVLLDGLDEVNRLSTVIKEIETFLSQDRYAKNHTVIMSRSVVFQRMKINGNFRVATLKPMNLEQIDLFIDKWYTHKSNLDKTEAAYELKEALKLRSGLTELATNPFMLTIVLLMNWRAGSLPARAIDVYAIATDTLITYWPAFQEKESIEETDLNTVKAVLKPIAYHMVSGNGLIGQDELIEKFKRGLIKEKLWDEVRADDVAIRWIKIVSDKSGFLMKKGIDKQNGKPVFGFLHQRFAEYLAACHLTDLWDAEDETVLGLINESHKWQQVIILSIVQSGEPDRQVLGSKLLDRLLNLESSHWEKIIYRNLLLCGKCLGEGININPELANEIIHNLVALLIDRDKSLRTRVIEILYNLRGTKYRQMAIETILPLLKTDLPSSISIAVATVLIELGETSESLNYLLVLRDNALHRVDSHTAASAIESLLKGNTKDTIEWLVKFSETYEGKGLLLKVGTHYSETEVSAGDESFDFIPVGKLLTKSELRTFLERLSGIASDNEQQQKIKWIFCLLEHEAANKIREFSSLTSLPELKHLATTWLIRHREIQLEHKDLIKSGGLFIAYELKEKGELENAQKYAYEAFTNASTYSEEMEALQFIIDINQTSTLLPTILDLLLYSQSNVPIELNKLFGTSNFLYDKSSFELSRSLLSSERRELGLTSLRMLSSKVDHQYRFESSESLGKNDDTDTAFHSLIDIAMRWGVLDRIRAVTTLNDSRYVTYFERENINLSHLAEQILSEIGQRYDRITQLLSAGIISAQMPHVEIANNLEPLVKRQDWDDLSKKYQEEFYAEIEKWLINLPQKIKQSPHTKMIVASLLIKKGETQKAIAILRAVKSRKRLSKSMLTRIRLQLLFLRPSKEAVYELLLAGLPENVNSEHYIKYLAALQKQDGNKKELRYLMRKVLITSKTSQEIWPYLYLLPSSDFDRNLANQLIDKILSLGPPQLLTWCSENKINMVNDKLVLSIASKLREKYPQFLYPNIVEITSLQSRGKYEAALKKLSDVLDVDPNFTTALIRYAQLNRKLGNYETAYQAIEQTLKTEKWNTKALLTKSEILKNTGRYAEALKTIDQIESYGGMDIDAQVLQAEMLVSLEKYSYALKHCNRVLESNSSNTQAWIIKTKALVQLGHLEEIVNLLNEAALGLDDKVKIAVIAALTEIPTSEAVAILLKLLNVAETNLVRSSAINLLGKLHVKTTLDTLINILRNDPSQHVRSTAAAAIGQFEDMDTIDSLTAALDDESIEVRKTAATAFGAITNEQILEKLIQMLSIDENDLSEAAATGLAFTNRPEVIEIFKQKLLSVDKPKSGNIYCRLGVLLRRLGQLDDAIVAHNQAVAILPYEPLVYRCRAITYMNKSEYELAYNDYRKAIYLDPDAYINWECLGIALFELEEYADAVKAWLRAKDADGREASIYAELGIGLWKIGEKEYGLHLRQKALASDERFRNDNYWLYRVQGWGEKMISTNEEIGNNFAK